MAYIRTIYVNDSTPPISAENLNKMEQGIYENDKSIGEITGTKNTIATQTATSTYTGIVYKSNGETRSGAVNDCAKYTVVPGNTIIVSGTASANNSGGVYGTPLMVYFNSSDTVVDFVVGTSSTSAVAVNNYETVVPAGASYAMVNNVTSYNTISLSVKETEKVIGTNSIDMTNVEDYYILDGTIVYNKQIYRTGQVVSDINTSSRYTLYDVQKYRLEKLKVSGFGGNNAYRPLCIFYSSSTLSTSTKISAIEGTSSSTDVNINNFEVTVPSNAAYMAINGTWRYNPSAKTKNKKGVLLMSEQNLNTSLSAEVLDNKLRNATILTNGDSIMLAYNSSHGWWGLLQEKYPNAIIKDYSVGGTGFVVDNNVSTIGARIPTMASEFPNPDYVILQGGVNDCYGNIAVGDLSDDYSTFDTSTIIGAFEKCISDVLSAFPNAIIIFILTYKIPNAGVSYKECMQKLRSACEKWSIPFCDLYNDSGIPLDVPYFTSNFTNNGDGTHYTLGAYKRTISKLIDVMINN